MSAAWQRWIGWAWLGLCLAALGGCGGRVAVQTTSVALDARQGGNLATVTYRMVPMQLPDAPTAASAGEPGSLERIDPQDLPDPADEIAFDLTALVAKRVTPTGFMALPGQDPAADAPSQLANLVGRRGMVFDVRTLSWSLSAFLEDTSRYQLRYLARARIIDAQSGETVGELPCAYVSDSIETAPTYAEWAARRAELLRHRLSTAARDCAALISRRMLDIDDSPVLAGAGRTVTASRDLSSVVPASVSAPIEAAAADTDASAAATGPATATTAEDAPAVGSSATAVPADGASEGPVIVLAEPAADASSSVPLGGGPAANAGTGAGSALSRPAPAPKALPDTTRLVVAGTVALSHGVVLRDSPTSRSGRGSMLVAGTRVRIGVRLVNADGAWRYLVGGGHSGWVLETELMQQDVRPTDASVAERFRPNA